MAKHIEEDEGDLEEFNDMNEDLDDDYNEPEEPPRQPKRPEPRVERAVEPVRARGRPTVSQKEPLRREEQPRQTKESEEKIVAVPRAVSNETMLNAIYDELQIMSQTMQDLIKLIKAQS